nr:aldolase/citrate lyase family protein [Candidatus Sigynarchaeota archaeon]
MEKSFRTRLLAGEVVTGTMVREFPVPAILHLFAEAGFDFVVIDQEHGPATYQSIQDMVIAAKALDITLLVRPPVNEYTFIARTLDMGAGGVMVPHVDTVEDARRAVNACRYPPVGQRSYGVRKFLSKGAERLKPADYITFANDLVVLLVQIETTTGSDNIKEILALDGIDGVIMGPADFTMSLGCLGNFEDARFVAHATRVRDECEKQGKAFGIHFADWPAMVGWVAKGMKVRMFGADFGLLSERARDVVRALKQHN